MNISTNEFSVNGKTYQPSAKPIVVICIDGSADEYLDITMAHDRMPNLKSMTVNGYPRRSRGEHEARSRSSGRRGRRPGTGTSTGRGL